MEAEKEMGQYANIKQIQDDLAPGLYDWYRCYKCARVITREEERSRILKMNKYGTEDATEFCPKCGSLKIYPLRAPSKTEWLRWHVLRYALKVVLGRGVAPWCERYFRVALPLLDRLVRLKEA